MDQAVVSSKVIDILVGIASVERGSISGDSALIGENGIVDSQGLLQLLLALEDYADETFGARFDWMTDAAFSEERSPFRTVSTLSSFLCRQIVG